MNSSARSTSFNDANTTVPEWVTPVLFKTVDLLSCSTYKVKYLKEVIRSKYTDETTAPGAVRRQRAINKWLATERNNEGTNDRLLTLHDGFRILPHVEYGRFLLKVRQIISDVIGDMPPWEAFIGSFSGGASTGRTRTWSHPASKYLGQADVTARAWSIFEVLLEDMPGWGQFRDELVPNFVPGNVLFTVPKNTDIDRCACKEPEINMFLQKGLGSYISKRLKRVGINLNDQSRNRDLAREGSELGNLATLDLSSASDSISKQLVFELLPIDWYVALDSCRSEVTSIDGEEHVNEMFSSMGNGFTFELESLIFYAIAKATAYFEGARGVISVYGDDIIVPVDAAQQLAFVLSVFGFEVNTKKSFWTGSFRESCGGHYYNGNDVTPFYVKGPIKRMTDLIHVLNSIRKWSEIEGLTVLDCTLEDLWLKLKALVPRRLWGGHDTSFKFQLASPDLPKSKLVQQQSKRLLGTGSYIHWLNTTWVRDKQECEPVETSVLSRNGIKCRYRPAERSAVHSLYGQFLTELAP